MISKKALVGAAAGVALTFGMASSASAKPSLAKCSKDIGKESTKVQTTMLKAFAKCNDAHRKDVDKGLPFTKAAPSCEKQLSKAEAKVAKEHAKLASKAPTKSCTDTDLQILGHLPTSFGNRWATNIVMYAVQSAYDEQISATRDWINMLTDLADAGCSTCSKYLQAPCQEHSCTYLTAGSEANVHLGTLDIPVPLTGVTGLKICGVSGNLLPGITTANEYVTFGEAGKQLDPSVISGVGFACVRAIGAEGYINCNGGASGLHVNYTTCQDHVVPAENADGAASSGDCSGVCLASAPDTGQAGTGLSTHAGVINGGACTALTQSGAVAGDAFIINTTQIAVVLNSEIGPDGQACTNDDTNASPGDPASTSLTTGTAASQLIDPNADEAADAITAGPTTGSPFNCGNIQSSNLAGGTIVGAFPALHAITLGGSALDSVTDFTLACQ